VRILRCRINNYRGFETVDLYPAQHVLLVGEPRSGRTDLVNAISKVFEIDATRLDERDFYRGELSEDVRIEVTVGDLHESLVQQFIDRLEFWDPNTEHMVTGIHNPAEMPPDSHSVIRLGYRGHWDEVDERAVQTFYWPVASDPGLGRLVRVSREERSRLPFHRIAPGKALNLAPRGLLRSTLTDRESEALDNALRDMREGIDELSSRLSLAEPVIGALQDTIEILRPYFGISDPVEDIVRFLPDEGSLSGLLRALSPALDLGDGGGHLPLVRHGSTTAAQIVAAEAIAAASYERSIVVVDDFGDQLDTSSAERLAALLKRKAGQVWLSTRRPETARSFGLDEVIRLRLAHVDGSSTRTIHQGTLPLSKSERIALRDLHKSVMPAMTARALIVVEGPHDLATYQCLSSRMEQEAGTLPPESYGIRIIDAGGGSGGIDSVPRIATLAESLGLRTISLVDYDHGEEEAAARLTVLVDSSSAVVRLPAGLAIERALLDGVPDGEIVEAMSEVNQSYSCPFPAGWMESTGNELRVQVCKVLKSNNGLHAQFLEVLPSLPPVAVSALGAAVAAAQGDLTKYGVQL